VNCEGCAGTISQNKLVYVYLVQTVAGLLAVRTCEAWLFCQAFGMWDKGSHIHGTVFVKIVW